MLAHTYYERDASMPRSQGIWRLSCVCLLVAGVHLTVAMPANAQDSDYIFFHEDYNKAVQEAKLTKKPLFLEFRCAP